MIWYNPLSWFEKPPYIGREVSLPCGNPVCDELILQGPVTYDKERGRLYHGLKCSREALVLESFVAGDPGVANLRDISFRRAERLARKGRLSKANSLEAEVD